MKKTLGLELFSELKRVFGDIYCRVLWSMAGASFLLATIGLRFKCYASLYSASINLFVFAFVFAVICTISWWNARRKVRKYLKYLPNDEKDLLIYMVTLFKMLKQMNIQRTQQTLYMFHTIMQLQSA